MLWQSGTGSMWAAVASNKLDYQFSEAALSIFWIPPIILMPLSFKMTGRIFDLKQDKGVT